MLQRRLQAEGWSKRFNALRIEPCTASPELGDGWPPPFRIRLAQMCPGPRRIWLAAGRYLFRTVEFMHGIEHGNDVFDRGPCLYIMNAVEYEASAPRKYLTSAQNLFPNLGR